VCRTLSCAMAGSYQLLDTFCKHAKIERDPHAHSHVATSADRTYSVEFVECLASCGTAPVCMVDDDLYEAVKEEDVPELLQRYPK